MLSSRSVKSGSKNRKGVVSEVASGKVLIETDHIETIEKVSEHTAKIIFVSGNVLEVHCGIKSTAPTVWDQTVDGFIQTIQNTDPPKLKKRNSTRWPISLRTFKTAATLR